MKQNLTRAGIVFGASALALPAGWLAVLIVAIFAAAINPFAYGLIGTSYPIIAGSTKSQITTAASRDEEVLWEHEVIEMAASLSPFADNMTGGLGSGKPVIVHDLTKKVLGTTINITTVDPMGVPLVQGNATRVGTEEQLSPGDFQLIVDIGFFAAGIDNTGKTQTIVGNDWDNISQKALAIRLSKQQSDDAMQDLKVEAVSGNTVFPNGKTIDTLGSADIFQTSLIVASGGLLSDLGANPIDARPVSLQDMSKGRINRYMQFTSEQNARPIKNESAYLEGIKFAQNRGENNNLFSGDYETWNNNVIYPWQVIQHGGIGSIGSAIQPDALLGTALLAHTAGVNTTFPTTATINGGGSTAKATALPLRNFFEFFPLFAYKPINGVTRTWTPRATYGYFVIMDSTTGKPSFFRYTGNNGNTLTGVKRLGSVTEGDYATTLGDVTYGTAPWTTTADGAGYLGTHEGAIAAGSKIYEANSKGQILGYGYGLGEMALVCGYGRVPLATGGFKSMINRTEYIAPYNQAFGKGIEVSYGTAAFKRPDTITPNYSLNIFSRRISGSPVIP